MHYSYTSLFSSDECVRRSLVQYVTLLLRNRTIDIHNNSITMLKLDEFNRILYTIPMLNVTAMMNVLDDPSSNM